MKKFLIVSVILFFSFFHLIRAQVNDSIKIITCDDLKKELFKISEIKKEEDRESQLNQLWNYLKNNKKIPFTQNNQAIFLYKGNAKKVSFEGDFSGWGRHHQDNSNAVKIKNIDVWYLEKEFPSDARLDYKIVVDGNWILDPDNENIQMSGFGPNSELRMPDWEPSPYVIRDSSIQRGKLIENIRIHSKNLGYSLLYHVYLPYNYDKLNDIPVIYVTDGHEYMDDQKGSMVIVLDNLIAKNLISPIIAIFIDPRDPDSLQINKRETQFLLNEKYLKFVSEELIPIIDSKYKTSNSPNNRAILGTSYGGVCATYFALMRPDIFKLIAIQSPAYSGAPRLEEIYKNSEKHNQKVFITSGTINDGVDLTRKVRDILKSDGYEIMYKEVNEGHSWGNWRALLDDILIYFWGK